MQYLHPYTIHMSCWKCTYSIINVKHVIFVTPLTSTGMLNHLHESGDPLKRLSLVAPTIILSIKVALCCHLVVFKVMTCLGT